MLVGVKTLEELVTLSRTGYFVNGKQRIAYDEEREGARYPKLRLWDDWEERKSHIWASNIALLIEVACIDISSWFWYHN